MRESFVFYKSFYDATRDFNNTDKGVFYDVISQYALFGKIPELSELKRVIRTAFILVKPQIDVNNKRYFDGCKGGGTKGNTNAKKTTTGRFEKRPNDNDNVNDNENVNEYKIRKELLDVIEAD